MKYIDCYLHYHYGPNCQPGSQKKDLKEEVKANTSKSGRLEISQAQLPNFFLRPWWNLGLERGLLATRHPG